VISPYNVNADRSSAVFHAGLGQGTHQQMLTPLTASSVPRSESQFGSLQQMQQQQGYNIFGLTPMQLQQMLMMQTQISQLQGNFSSNQIADQVRCSQCQGAKNKSIAANTEIVTRTLTVRIIFCVFWFLRSPKCPCWRNKAPCYRSNR